MWLQPRQRGECGLGLGQWRWPQIIYGMNSLRSLLPGAWHQKNQLAKSVKRPGICILKKSSQMILMCLLIKRLRAKGLVSFYDNHGCVPWSPILIDPSQGAEKINTHEPIRKEVSCLFLTEQFFILLWRWKMVELREISSILHTHLSLKKCLIRLTRNKIWIHKNIRIVLKLNLEKNADLNVLSSKKIRTKM